MNVRGVGQGSLTERQHCTTCIMLLKQKENATSIFHDDTILSSCLTTCNVDFVTMRPKTSRNFNCTRDRTTLVREDLSKPAMGGWRVAKRATPEGEESSARDSKLPKSGGNGSMKASARSAASYEDTLARSIVALQKLSLKHDQEIRELAGALTDFWLAPKTLQAVKAGMEAGADYMEEIKKRGRGHGLGAPYTHVAAAFVEALAAEAEGPPKQTLTTFMELVAERKETVTECFGAFRVKEAYSAEETPAAQVTMSFNALGLLKKEVMLEEGLEVRDVRRAIAQTLEAKEAEW